MTLEGIAKYPIVFLAAFLATYTLVPFVLDLSRRFGLIDRPGERRLNQRPVARGGGIAVFIGFHVGCFVIFGPFWRFEFKGSLNLLWWEKYLAVSSFLLLVGILDDRFNLRWSTKLGAQVLCAAAMYALGINAGAILGIPLPGWIDLPVTIAWYVSLTNAFNLIDGLDGLASGLAAIAALGLAGAALLRFEPTDALVLLSLCGACAAFLRFNFHPATIFLGDSGSMFLGFTLATISLCSNTKTSMVAAVGVPFLAFGIPVFDTLLAIWRRSVRAMVEGKTARFGIMQADMDHLHHRLLRLGLSQRRVALSLYALNVALVGVGLLSVVFYEAAMGIYTLAFVACAYLVLKHLVKTELWDSGILILRGLNRPTGHAVGHAVSPVLDLFILLASFSMAARLALFFPDTHEYRVYLRYALPLWAGLPFICMALTGIYNRLWSKARIADFLSLLAALLGGIGVAFGIELATLGPDKSTVLLGLLHSGFALSATIVLRVFPKAVRDLMGLLTKPGGVQRKVLVYGAGARGLLYLVHRNLHTGGATLNERIHGFLDDDIALHRRRVHGYPVLGGLRDLQAIAGEGQVSVIVITAALPRERRRILLEFTQKSNIEVREWAVSQITIDPEPQLERLNVERDSRLGSPGYSFGLHRPASLAWGLGNRDKTSSL